GTENRSPKIKKTKTTVIRKLPSAAFAALPAVCVSLPPAPCGTAERISPDQLPAVRQAAERGDAGAQYALGDCYAAKAGQPGR
ncbi:MAG: hypothetical protein LIO63_08185, partial [Akkermansia sp.]|nr:hypothetical protein [Akkermansia sp.]